MRIAALLLLLFTTVPALAQSTGESTLEDRVGSQDALVAAGRYDDAIEAARRRVDEERDSAEARYLLGRLYGNEGNRLAGEARRAAGRDGREDAEALRLKAVSNVEQAGVQFQGALELDAYYAPAWRGMAKVHLLQEKFDTAVREARRAAELDHETLEGKVLLVECLYRSGDRPGAYRLLEEELAAAPGNHDLRFFYASLLHNEGRSRDAEAELRAVLAKEPKHIGARRLLIMILATTGRKKEAASACAEGIAAVPDEPVFLGMQRDLAVDVGDLDLAVKAMEALLELPLPEAEKARARHDLDLLRGERDRPSAPPGPPTFDDVLKLLESPDALVRRDAMAAIFASGLPQGMSRPPRPVVEAITDSDEMVRIYAVRIISSYGGVPAAGLFEPLLLHPTSRDPSASVRAFAARGLAATGSPAVLPPLFKALANDEPQVLRAAVSGIALITGKRFVEDPEAPIPESERAAVRERYTRWWDTHPTATMWKRRACEAIGESGMSRLAVHMIPWFEADDERLREAVRGAMAVLSGDDSWKKQPIATTEERTAALERAAAWIERPRRTGER